MEVLNENTERSDRTRRRGDRHESDQRALSWVQRDGDIMLYPHSPLAFADVLSTPKGCFDLIPEGASAPTEKKLAEAANLTNTATTSLQQRRQHSNPRLRANLLTQLPQEKLLDACKQVQIENALVKKAGVRRLYLAAGFFSWTNTNDEGGVEFRAPILYYPVTLIRKSQDSDLTVTSNSANTAVSQRGEERALVEYELQLTDELPDTNKALLHWFEQNKQITIPRYTSDTPLQDYFAQLAEAISGERDMELLFEIGLGNAAPPDHKSEAIYEPPRLPELPEHFDTNLAMAITSNKNLQQLRSVLNLLSNYEQMDTSALPVAANEAKGAVSHLHEYSKKLSDAGLSMVEFQHLPTMPENIAKWIDNINAAMQSKIIVDVLNNPKMRARHLIRLAGVIELIDKAPLAIEQFKHADLCYAATPNLLQRAHHQARLIEDELSTLQNTFVLDKVPAKKQLLSLIGELGGSVEDEPDIVDADYFNARRQFMEFSIEKPTNLTPEHRQLLGKLAKVLRFRELFVNNTEYRLALGPGYRGLRTDWDLMNSLVEYAQEFAEVLESESLASTALKKWSEFRTTYVNELDVLQTAAESLRKLLWVCGAEWQTRKVSDVIDQAGQTRMKLLAWSEIYGDVTSKIGGGENKTPANVLSQFTGKSQEDMLTEIHVGETQAMIEEHLSDNDAASDSVAETLEWLRLASETGIEQELEINAIVEHLRIA